MMERANFIGIDLTSFKRSTACVALDEELCLAWFDLLSSDGQIIAAIESHHPRIVAIDAPLGLPNGLCCLEESCSCQPLSYAKGRVCERELSHRGIPCYYTTKKSIIKDMVYRAISLRERINARGYQVIEVYPYATKVQLFGRQIPPKTTPAGIIFLKKRLADVMPHLIPCLPKFNHDLYDALLAAYTAYLYIKGEVEIIGDPEESAIFIPASSPLTYNS
jgi:predicted nuclease with RNAse H fold